jgi:hypothetical protein
MSRRQSRGARASRPCRTASHCGGGDPEPSRTRRRTHRRPRVGTVANATRTLRARRPSARPPSTSTTPPLDLRSPSARERRRVDPERAVVACQERRGGRPDRGRAPAAWLDRRRPAAVPPAAAAEPASWLHRLTSAATRLSCQAERGRVLRRTCAGDRPRDECTCASLNPGSTQRPPRSTRSRGERRPCVPTPRDPVAGDRKRPRDRNRRVHRPDRPVLEDHNSKNAPVTIT